MRQKINFQLSRTRRRRGFLLVVVIGILAILLTVCVGFLSYTRGEVASVSSQRDKNDTMDVMHTSIDWSLACICKDLLTPSGQFNPAVPVSLTTTPVNWWHRPYESGYTAFIKNNWWAPPPHMAASNEAQWTYLPADFFPGGGVRGRFMVQIMDPNSCVNINDWNEDCNPTQCQMAHMVMDGYGAQYLESARQLRDTGTAGGFHCPLRYQEGWRAATHTCRYLDWLYQDYWRSEYNIASYNWVTGNTSWFNLFGPDYMAIHPTLQSDGMAEAYGPIVPTQSYKGSTGFYPIDTPGGNTGDSIPIAMGWGQNQNSAFMPMYMSGFTVQAYVDPDTGRSPVNVNTCYNSGEILPVSYWDPKSYAYTMEAVWNIESLRRIIKVGNFYFNGVSKNAQANWGTLTPDEKMKVEQLKTKLAYQYQETLCRYFTGTYNHAGDSRKYAPFSASAIGTYATVYGSALPGACTVTNYSAPRFPVSLALFRTHCSKDLLSMATSAHNAAFTGTSDPRNIDHTDGTVSFDKTDIPEVAQGKLDMRTAAACYDNLVPGKPADLVNFNGCHAYQATGNDCDPIFELYTAQVGRAEDQDDIYNLDPTYNGSSYGGASLPPVKQNNIYGSWADNANLGAMSFWDMNKPYPDPSGENDLKDHTGKTMNLTPKGKDVCAKAGATIGPWSDSVLGSVPRRQLCFSPDSFSTELTTTTTTFMLIINAELVDGPSVTANPANPALHRAISWNQWGVVLELAPGVEKLIDANNPEGEFYKNGWPRVLKSASNNASFPATLPAVAPYAYKNDVLSMDTNCASLVSRNFDEIGMRIQNQFGMAYNNPISSGPVDLEHNNATAITDWQTDIRGVAPAQEPTVYNAANQINKRIFIRSLWCLNQGIQR